MTRLYLPPSLATGPQTLAPEREHYLRNVLRLKDGAPVTVFDGDGVLADARVTRDGRNLALTIERLLPALAPPATRLHLAFALLKGKASEQVLRRATELGATDLWPLYTDHTAVPRKLLATADSAHQLGIIISACEQCGQNQLPNLHPGQSLDALLNDLPATQVLFADMNTEDFPASLSPRDSMLIIGPEGGWSERERTLAIASDLRGVNLGSLVLRAETAPIVGLAMLTMALRAPS